MPPGRHCRWCSSGVRPSSTTSFVAAILHRLSSSAEIDGVAGMLDRFAERLGNDVVPHEQLVIRRTSRPRPRRRARRCRNSEPGETFGGPFRDPVSPIHQHDRRRSARHEPGRSSPEGRCRPTDSKGWAMPLAVLARTSRNASSPPLARDDVAQSLLELVEPSARGAIVLSVIGLGPLLSRDSSSRRRRDLAVEPLPCSPPLHCILYGVKHFPVALFCCATGRRARRVHSWVHCLAGNEHPRNRRTPPLQHKAPRCGARVFERIPCAPRWTFPAAAIDWALAPTTEEPMRMRHGIFLPPFHALNENPHNVLHRDLEASSNGSTGSVTTRRGSASITGGVRDHRFARAVHRRGLPRAHRAHPLGTGVISLPSTTTP